MGATAIVNRASTLFKQGAGITDVSFPSRLLGIAVGLSCAAIDIYTNIDTNALTAATTQAVPYLPSILTTFDQGATWQARLPIERRPRIPPLLHELCPLKVTENLAICLALAGCDGLLHDSAVVCADPAASEQPPWRWTRWDPVIFCPRPDVLSLHHPVALLRRGGVRRRAPASHHSCQCGFLSHHSIHIWCAASLSIISRLVTDSSFHEVIMSPLHA